MFILFFSLSPEEEINRQNEEDEEEEEASVLYVMVLPLVSSPFSEGRETLRKEDEAVVPTHPFPFFLKEERNTKKRMKT